jgi:hypothetical protein
LPELRIGSEVVFERIPTIIIVRPTSSKVRHKVLCIPFKRGMRVYLKEYLRERIRAGEELKPDSPLIAHERKEALRNHF